MTQPLDSLVGAVGAEVVKASIRCRGAGVESWCPKKRVMVCHRWGLLRSLNRLQLELFDWNHELGSAIWFLRFIHVAVSKHKADKACTKHVSFMSHVVTALSAMWQHCDRLFFMQSLLGSFHPRTRDCLGFGMLEELGGRIRNQVSSEKQAHTHPRNS